MTLIATLLRPEYVIADLEATSKKRALELIGELVEKNTAIPGKQIFDSLFAREKLGSTGLGDGIAIPHGRIKSLKEAIGAYIRLKAPIPFDAPDGNPVSQMFVLLVPDQATDLHLQILSELAQMFSDRSLRQRLLACADTESLHRLITAWTPNG